ncbi:MAG: MazG family protein, partial [Actinomycetota bacterium]|nr:MazG family protein [Actinomycetota bacterium]
MTGHRLVLLQTSPRVAPGLLTAPAWDLLRGADVVLCADPPPLLRDAVVAAGVEVRVTSSPAADLVAVAGTAASVVWLSDPDDDEAELRSALAAEVVRRAGEAADALTVEAFAASYDLPGAHLIDLVEVMDRLRTGCPWDREQDHRSLARYLLEETYEALEAIETGDRVHLREELGDLLMQVAFHSRIAAEHPEDPWTIDDVAADIVDKLVRRHPHVFADVQVAGVADVEANWAELKAAEKRRTSVLDGVPMALPALALADKVLGRAAQAGVVAGQPVPAADVDADRLGDALLALVAGARTKGLDAEQELRGAVRRLAERLGTG